MGKALIENYVAYSPKTFPEIQPIFKLQNERYSWNYELDMAKQLSPRQILEDKQYSSLLEKIHNSEIPEKDLLKNPEFQIKYENYIKSQSAMMGRAWTDAVRGGLLFITGIISLGILYHKKIIS